MYLFLFGFQTLFPTKPVDSTIRLRMKYINKNVESNINDCLM